MHTLYKKFFQKILLAIFTMMLLQLSAQAQKMKGDFVTVLKINGVDVINTISYRQMVSIFGKHQSIERAEFTGATGNFDITFNYPDKVVNLEYFPEENPKGIEIAEKFNLSRPDFSKLPENAQVWVIWNNIASLKEKLEVGSYTITPKLTFDQFKQYFPMSVEPYNTEKTDNGSENIFYYVSFGTEETKKLYEEEPSVIDPLPYSAAVIFIFNNNQLVGLEIFQGIAY